MAEKFQGVDFYDLDSLLSEEEKMVRGTIRDWVEEKVLPIIQDAYIQHRFPKELIPEMAELGIYGANLPEEYADPRVLYEKVYCRRGEMENLIKEQQLDLSLTGQSRGYPLAGNWGRPT